MDEKEPKTFSAAMCVYTCEMLPLSWDNRARESEREKFCNMIRRILLHFVLFSGISIQQRAEKYDMHIACHLHRELSM